MMTFCSLKNVNVFPCRGRFGGGLMDIVIIGSGNAAAVWEENSKLRDILFYR